MTYAPSIIVFLFLVAPGIRLLLLSSKTRQAPEFLGGLYFVGASIGISLRILGASTHATNPELALQLNTIGHIGLAGGTIAIAIFTQRVFHPESARARLFSLCAIAAILATTAHTLLAGFVSTENSYSMLATNTARIVPTSWAFVESFVYWRSMRKRRALGLADPVVTNRFLLWTLWTGSVSFLPLMTLVLRLGARALFNEADIDQAAAEQIQAQAIGILRIVFMVIVPVAFVSLMLSFFPPSAYLERVRRRAATSN